jgi:predicted component of type VI protein secretion system
MSEVICPSCGTPAPAGAVFCDNCGFDLRHVAPSTPVAQVVAPVEESLAGGNNCPVCGHPNVPGAVFCENCGAEMSAMPAEQPVVEAAAAPLEAAAPEPALTPVEAPPVSAPQPAPQLAPAPVPAPAAMLTSIPGSVLLRATNVSLPIPPGKQTIVLGREDPVSGIFPDLDLDPHGGLEAGVGRQHARLVLQDGQVCLEDLNSVNGTALNRQRLSPLQPTPVKDGDEIRLGKLVLIYSAA